MWLPWLDSVSVKRSERLVVFGNNSAGVEIIGGKPLIDDAERDGARSAREGARGGLGIAHRGLEDEIAMRPHLGGIRCERPHGANHRRQWLPVDHNRLGGIARPVKRIRNHEGDRIADMAHGIACEDRIWRHIDGAARHLALARQVAERGGVGACEHERDARHRARLGDVSDAKARMRMRGAQHDRVQASWRRVIGNVAPGATQERVIFLARDRLAGAEFGSEHGTVPPAI